MGRDSERVRGPQSSGLSYIEKRLKELVADDDLQVSRGKENYLRMCFSNAMKFQVTKQRDTDNA